MTVYFEPMFLSAVFSSTHQKDLKRRQCLDIDDMTSPSEYVDVTWPSAYFKGRSKNVRKYRIVATLLYLKLFAIIDGNYSLV